MSGMMQRRRRGGCLTAAMAFVLVCGMVVGLARAALHVTHLSSFGARPTTAAGADTVTYIAAAAYEDTATDGTDGTWDYTYSATHTKNASTDFIVVAFAFVGDNNWTQFPTGGTGTRALYCGSAMTFITASDINVGSGGSDNDDEYIEWWYLRGPSAGACAIKGEIERTTASGGTGGGSSDAVNNTTLSVMEFSGVKSSGTPYEGVARTTTSGTTGAITLTPITAQMAVWGKNHDANSTIGDTCPTPDFGTCDAKFYNSLDIHTAIGHYKGAGEKTIALTWGGGVSRNAAITGFHLIGN